MSQSRLWRKLFAANVGVTANQPTVLEQVVKTTDNQGRPSGVGYLPFGSDVATYVPWFLDLMPICDGTADEQFTVGVYNWRETPIGTREVRCWERETLALLTCTVGTATGVTGGSVGSMKYVDTIAIAFEPTTTADATRAGTVVLASPANNTNAWASVPLVGSGTVMVAFSSASAAIIGMNVLTKPRDY